MSGDGRIYAAIDLKSFYASCECVDRGLDPLATNLVVADPTRTNKTICLAVSPSLKAYGIPGRPRLFEVEQAVAKINAAGKTRLEYIVAPPRMARYMEVSAQIYRVYLKYVASEDIFAYSIDEVFIDLTAYLRTYGKSAHELTMEMVRDVLGVTGITATAGIGTNLFLAKVAMDVVAKHADPDKDGVRIAELDEMSYRRLLWCHTPITDIWRVGGGIARRLAKHGIFTMGDIARASVSDDKYIGEPMLYKEFGVNAELLIDHAWGYEPCTLADVKAYEPENTSISSGQVLMRPYEYDEARIIVQEMTDLLVLDLVDKGLVCNAVVLTISYDNENLSDPEKLANFEGNISMDYYGRLAPEHAHGTAALGEYTSSTRKIISAMMELYDRIVDPKLLVRRVNVVAVNTLKEGLAPGKPGESMEFEQLDLFTDYSALEARREEDRMEEEKEKQLQHAVLDIKKKFGKNAILKGMNLQKGAMTIERNNQVGGHKA